MDEIGDEFDDKSENDKPLEEPLELTNESDEPDEFDDDIPETFSEPDEFDDDIPETFSEPDEFDDDIPETFSEPDEFDDDIPETFSEPDEFDDDIPETFSEPDEFGDILDDTIQDKEDGERADEDLDSGDVGNVIENENIGSQSTSTVLTSEIEEIESNMEHQEQEEEIEIRPEEYQDDTEPIVNTDESEFIKDVEELTEYARETKGEDESVEPQAEKENAAYYAEQYYEKLKEKEVINEQNIKEEQETEELRQEVAEELKGDQESGYKSDELEKEDISETSKEITSTEEFEYLWEVRDKLDREGKSPEEVEEVMHEAEEMYETLKNAEKLYEEQELEKLKLVDHEDEATEEDLKEDLDRVDLVEQAVELEENLFQQGESQEEINTRVEESIETTKFEEKLENIIEEQELEKLKLVDHEDEATEEDLKEELDRVDLVEQAVELEENLIQQGKLQEEIDARVEESIETTKFEESLEEIIELEQNSIVNKKLKKRDLEINEQNSNENVENEENLEVLKPELDAMESEADEEEVERLQELYRRETGRRPIYSRQKTKGYSQWLEQRELGAEKLKNSKSESEKKKEIDEEDWKATLKRWIKDASEEEYNAEFKSELKKALESYDAFEDLTREYLELYDKSQDKKLSEKEKNRLKSLTERLRELDPIKFELLKSVFFIKKHIAEQYYDDFWNWPLVNRVLSKFFKYISQKWKNLKKAQENKEKSKEIIRNWIEQASEGEISPELKEKIKEIVANKENLEVLKLELDAIEIDSEDKKDLLEEITKLRSEESDEENWKTTLKQWIREASEEECNAELISELKKALESYNEFEDLTRKFIELYEKSQHEKLTEKEKNRIKALTERLQGLGPIQSESLANIRAFKDYFYNHLWELMNRFFVIRVRNKFFKHISQKYKELIDIDRNTIIKLLHNKGVREKRFIHNKLPYYFKWINQKIKNSNLSLEFQESLIEYFDYLMKGNTFGIFLSNNKNFSCSSFKIKYLKFGSRKLIRKNLIKKNLIVEYNAESRSIPLFLRNLIHSAGKIEGYMRRNSESNILRHSRLEDLVLLENKNILAIEVPIWDNVSYITGHIDIISYYHDGKKSGILIADYKPDVKVGKSYDFVSFLPQVCMYGLLFRKAFGLNNDFEIKCLIFNRECCWIFKPDLIYNLSEEIREYYNPNRFIEFKDIFGNMQDYLLTNWTTLCKLKCLTNLKLDSFLLSVKCELLKILNIEKKGTFADIGREILRLINILNEDSNISSKSESLSDLIHASQYLFNLNFYKNEQDILINFFNSFQFDLGLWGENLSYQTATSLKILHSIQKLCYVFSHGFSKKMIQRGKGETYKEYLMFAYLLSTKFTGNSYFSCLEIIHISNRTYATFITQRNKLIRYGLIEKVGYARIKGGKYYFLYNLTRKGVMLAKMILKVWNSNFHKEFKIWYRNMKKLFINWLKNEYPPLDFTIHMVDKKHLPESTQKLQGSDPEFKQKVSEALKKKHKQPEYREKNIGSLQRAREAHVKKIDDEFEFLNSLKNKVKMLNLKKRYDMTGSTINSKISEILGFLGINNYRNAVQYLEDKDIDEVLSNMKNNKDVVDEIYYITKFIKKLQLPNQIRDTSIFLFREAKGRGFRTNRKDFRTTAAACIYLGLKIYNSPHTIKGLSNALPILNKNLISRVKKLKSFIDFELSKSKFQETSISDISKLEEIPYIKEVLQCVLSLKVSKKRYIIDILKNNNVQEFRVQENLDSLLKNNLIKIDNPVKTRAHIYSLSAEGEKYVLNNSITKNRQFYIKGLILLFSYDLQLIPHILHYLFEFSELQTNQLLELIKTKSTTLHKNMEILAGMNIIDKKKVLKKGHYQNLYFLTKEGLKICNNEVFNNFLYNSFSYNFYENEIFKILNKDQELTTTQISEYLNLDSVKTYNSLSRLEEKGFLKKRVERKSAKSVAYWKLKK